MLHLEIVINNGGYLLLGILLLTFFFASCKKEESYSCDPNVNEWVKTYKSELADVTREQLVTLPVKYQNAVFESLSPQKKLYIWNEKIDSVLLLEWDEVTKAKIVDLKNHLQSIDFTRDRFTPPSNITKNYLDAWENDVLSNHRMDSVQFIINFCTFMTYSELDRLVYHPQTIDVSWVESNQDIKDILMRPVGGGGGSASTVDCQCRYDVYCNIFLSDDCAPPTGGCGTTYNCGLLGNSACKGVCPELAD